MAMVAVPDLLSVPIDKKMVECYPETCLRLCWSSTQNVYQLRIAGQQID